MAIFSGKVVSAQFIDPPNNMIIEILYGEEGQEGLIPFVLEVDFTQQDFLDLLDEYTLEEISENTQALIKEEQKAVNKFIDDEINRRWENEQYKIKEAYDKAEKYAQEVIERESKRIEDAWKEIDNNWNTLRTEYSKMESSWKEIEKESARIENAWKEIEKQSANVEKSWKEIEKESANVEKSWKEIEKESANVEKSWKEISGESDRIKKSWDEIESGYKKVDEYAEGEKAKKIEEVQTEFQKLRQELATRFNTGTTTTKLEAKDVFQQLSGNEQDQDFVFNLKIAILEDPLISKSKDKTMKLKIRKSKSVTELLSIYYGQKAA